MKNLKIVFQKDNKKIIEFKPRLFKLVLVETDNMYFKKWIRFLLAYIYGSKFYYLLENDDVVGYLMIEKGNKWRYDFASSNDIIAGPIFIKSQYRGKKYSELLLRIGLEYYNKEYNYQKAFAYIWRTNIASNKLFLKVGFSIVAQLKVRKISRRIFISDQNQMYQLFELKV